MSTSPTVDRESFQTFLASAFAVQQSHMDRQSLSAIIKLAMEAKSGSPTQGEAAGPIVDARSQANTTEATSDSSRERKLPLMAIGEDDRNSGVFLSHLASTLSAHGSGAASAGVALDLALNDISEQARE